MTICRLALLGVVCCALQTTAIAQTWTFRYNYLERINLPTAQQDAATQSVVKQLATTSVPTVKDAVTVGMFALHNTPNALSADETVSVSGLYTIGGDAPGFARHGDLVWEVVISVGDGVRRVIWVSTTTKATRVLFLGER
jgi:hypothetical protein